MLKQAFLVELTSEGDSLDVSVRIRGDASGFKITSENHGPAEVTARFGHDVAIDDRRHNATALVPVTDAAAELVKRASVGEIKG